mgnify:CR=1 FL=1
MALLRLLNRITLGFFISVPRLLQYPIKLARFFADFLFYKYAFPQIEKIPFLKLQPALFDKSDIQTASNYFYQDTWCAHKIFENKPSIHVDIGSTISFVGIISQFVRTISVDIRPLQAILSGLKCVIGSIINLSYDDDSLESISSLCVIEHVGLGRYGDPLNQRGADMACEELIRVLAPSGNLYVSTQIGMNDETYFNSHRVFTRDTFVKKFRGLKLIEEIYIQNGKMYNTVEKCNLGFDTFGCFHFTK